MITQTPNVMQHTSKIKLNILLRTSNRPKGFSNILNIIRNQTYKDYRLIISVDNDFSLNYVLDAGIPIEDIVIVSPNIPHNTIFQEPEAKYNLYFNSLIEKVEDGLIYCVDDDDDLIDENVFQKIIDNYCGDEYLYIYKINFHNRNIPSYFNWGKTLQLCDVSTQNFVVHSKHAKKIKWDGFQLGDGRFVINLAEYLGKIKWVDEVIYVITQSNQGKSEI